MKKADIKSVKGSLRRAGLLVGLRPTLAFDDRRRKTNGDRVTSRQLIQEQQKLFIDDNGAY